MAYDLIGSAKVREALDLGREPLPLRESYGMTVFGQSCAVGPGCIGHARLLRCTLIDRLCTSCRRDGERCCRREELPARLAHDFHEASRYLRVESDYVIADNGRDARPADVKRPGLDVSRRKCQAVGMLHLLYAV